MANTPNNNDPINKPDDWYKTLEGDEALKALEEALEEVDDSTPLPPPINKKTKPRKVRKTQSTQPEPQKSTKPPKPYHTDPIAGWFTTALNNNILPNDVMVKVKNNTLTYKDMLDCWTKFKHRNIW